MSVKHGERIIAKISAAPRAKANPAPAVAPNEEAVYQSTEQNYELRHELRWILSGVSRKESKNQ